MYSGYYPWLWIRLSLIRFLWAGSFQFSFYEICFRNCGDVKFWEMLVEDSDTGGPSSIMVRMEYLLDFQFWLCYVCAKNRWGEAEIISSLIFCSMGCFSYRWIKGGGELSLGEGWWDGAESLTLARPKIASFCPWFFRKLVWLNPKAREMYLPIKTSWITA